MNSFIKSLVAITAISLPAAFIAEMFGVSLPDFIDTAHAFGAFVIALTVLTMWTEYAPAKSLVPVAAPSTADVPAKARRAALPLAA